MGSSSPLSIKRKKTMTKRNQELASLLMNLKYSIIFSHQNLYLKYLIKMLNWAQKEKTDRERECMQMLRKKNWDLLAAAVLLKIWPNTIFCWNCDEGLMQIMWLRNSVFDSHTHVCEWKQTVNNLSYAKQTYIVTSSDIWGDIYYIVTSSDIYIYMYMIYIYIYIFVCVRQGERDCWSREAAKVNSGKPFFFLTLNVKKIDWLFLFFISWLILQIFRWWFPEMLGFRKSSYMFYVKKKNWYYW